jgi:glyoxylase-like metal-dependent hydrolase (beta-lactamase superfamily II)
MEPTSVTCTSLRPSSEASGALRLGWLLVPAFALACAHQPPPAQTTSVDIAFLETTLLNGPTRDPRLIFILMGQYGARRQQRAGVAFFESILEQSKGRLSPDQEGLYEVALGTLMAQMAEQIPLLERMDWAETAVAHLDRAFELTQGKVYVVRWLRAVVLGQLPSDFERLDDAIAELTWCLDHISESPVPGGEREIHFSLASAYEEKGELDKAVMSLKKSGYSSLERSSSFSTGFSVREAEGFTFAPERVREVIPGTVYQATGFDFTEFYFVVSQGGKELIAIDAGSRDDSASRAIDAVYQRYPHLPPLSTVLVTHAHWDHIGGHRAFRQRQSNIQFVASAAWRAQVRDQEGSGGKVAYWFGRRFDQSAMESFKPDVEISEKTSIARDGTRIDAVPLPGGETEDALLYVFPDQQLAFGGDFVMPYLGAPFVSEGSVEGLVKAIQIVQAIGPKVLLHGHDGINGLFPQPSALYPLAPALTWLQQAIEARLAQGMSEAAIQHENLIPEDILSPNSQTFLPFLVIREHAIKRTVDRKVGYWQPDFGGSDTLTERELGSVLTHYLDQNEDAVARAIERMLEAGDFTLARRTLAWVAPHFPKSDRLASLRTQAHLRLMEQYQTLNAFKFLWYAQDAGIEVPPLGKGTISVPSMVRQNRTCTSSARCQ